jgi:hypothetical protein
VPVALEISRSGNGAHAWIFFSEAADLMTEEKKVLKKAIQAELEARRRKP